MILITMASVAFPGFVTSFFWQSAGKKVQKIRGTPPERKSAAFPRYFTVAGSHTARMRNACYHQSHRVLQDSPP